MLFFGNSSAYRKGAKDAKKPLNKRKYFAEGASSITKSQSL